MPRIVHIALKVDDLDRARRFYEELFGFRHRGTIRRAGNRHAACHLSDGTIDLTLLGYDGEDAPEAQLSGAGTCIHHFGIEVSDPDAFMTQIAAAGAEIVSNKKNRARKFRLGGVLAEIIPEERFTEESISAQIEVERQLA
jgi:catechol 2,3-dioxygenase-like lactoylglutathione lyase family enzyme